MPPCRRAVAAVCWPSAEDSDDTCSRSHLGPIWRSRRRSPACPRGKRAGAVVRPVCGERFQPPVLRLARVRNLIRSRTAPGRGASSAASQLAGTVPEGAVPARPVSDGRMSCPALRGASEVAWRTVHRCLQWRSLLAPRERLEPIMLNGQQPRLRRACAQVASLPPGRPTRADAGGLAGRASDRRAPRRWMPRPPG